MYIFFLLILYNIYIKCLVWRKKMRGCCTCIHLWPRLILFFCFFRNKCWLKNVEAWVVFLQLAKLWILVALLVALLLIWCCVNTRPGMAIHSVLIQAFPGPLHLYQWWCLLLISIWLSWCEVEQVHVLGWLLWFHWKAWIQCPSN